MARGMQDAALPQGADAASASSTAVITTATTTVVRIPTPSLAPQQADTGRDETLQRDGVETQAPQHAAGRNADDTDKEVHILDGDQVFSTDYWFLETNGTMNDGMTKLSSRQLRETKRIIAKGREEGVSLMAQVFTPDINVLHRWAV